MFSSVDYNYPTKKNRHLAKHRSSQTCINMIVLPLPASIGLGHLIPPSFKNLVIKGSYICKWRNCNETLSQLPQHKIIFSQDDISN